MKNLNLVVNQNEISQDGNEYLTSGGYKSIQCNFSFSEEWNNLTKTAIFLYNGVAYNETLVDDKCFVPHEAIENKGELSIGVFGTEILGENLEKRNTTDLLNVKIYEGSFIKGIQPEKPSPETWELYLEEVNKLIEEATNKIDSFTAEDIKFEDGETFQEKYDNGEFSGTSADLMKRTIYDSNNNGIVDNSEKVNGHIIESDVPVDAVFTDTTYDIATKTNDGLMSASDKQKLDGQVAELDEYGKVLSSQLPSYVDDVVEATLATFPESGESGKIYVDIETNLSYRWTGTAYTVISPSIALGETSSTAYRGDRGKIAYEHSQKLHAPVNAQENVIENIKVDGVDLAIENKEININLEENLVHVSSTEPTDENRKKVWLQKNKNLFNKNDFLPNSSTSAEGVLISNNSTNTYYIPVEYGNSYIMSFVNNGVSGNVLYGFCDTQPSLGVSCTYNVATADKLNNMKFTPVSENNKYLCIRLRYDDTQLSYMSNIQIEQGSTVTTYEENVTSTIYTKNNNEYEKYSETVAISSHQPINQNGLWLQKSKNLLNFSSFGTKTINGVTFTNNGNGTITINGNASASFGVNFVKFNLGAGTYHLSVNANTSQNFYIYDYDTNTNILSKEATATLTKDYNNIGLDTYINNGQVFDNLTISPQLEVGSSTSAFEEYKDKKIYTKNDNGVYEEFLNADEVKNNYSLAERRIGTWIDGKPLYGKTINFGTLPNVSTKNVAHNITNLGIITDIKGIIISSTTFLPLPFVYESDATKSIRVYADKNNIYIGTGSDRSSYSAYVTIKYTKTDVATTSEE